MLAQYLPTNYAYLNHMAHYYCRQIRRDFFDFDWEDTRPDSLNWTKVADATCAYLGSRYWTPEEIAWANGYAGEYWFSPNTLTYFKTRLLDTFQVPPHVFLVVSDRTPDGRMYRYLGFDPTTGRIDYASDYWRTAKTARDHAQKAVHAAYAAAKTEKEVTHA